MKGNMHFSLVKLIVNFRVRPNQALKLTEWASPASFTKKQLSAGSYVKHGD